MSIYETRRIRFLIIKGKLDEIRKSLFVLVIITAGIFCLIAVRSEW